MNAASQWRYHAVQPLAASYAAHPHVAAVLLGGSTARGHADRYSDIEVGVFWQQPPTDADRQLIANAITGDLVRLYPYDPAEEVWSDDYMLGRAHPDQAKSGVLVEVVNYTTDFVDRTLTAVLDQYDPDSLKQLLIAGIVSGVPLHRAAQIADWKARAATYPDGLALAVIQRHAVIDHFWRWQMWLDRNENLMMLYHAYTQIQQQLLHMLLGLNRVYYFGFKWLDVINAHLVLQPTNFPLRLRQVYQQAPVEGAHILAALVDETYDLIERQFPQIDVPWLRSVFHYQRPFWDTVPPDRY